MRILQISSADYLGGGERYLADLSNALVSRGHEVFVASRPDSPLLSLLSDVKPANVISLSLRNSFDAQSARALAAFVKKHRIEILHAHMARDYPLVAYAGARNSKCSFVITRHVLFPLHRFHKLTLSRVTKVIAVSEAVGEQLRRDVVVSPEKIAVVHNGIDVDRLDRALVGFNPNDFLRQWDLPADALLVGTVGELKALKGQEEFLRAAAQLAEEFPKTHFVIAGVDTSRAKQQRAFLETLATELNITGRVLFIGWLDEIAPLYRALDIFISASRSESFGLAMGEAMACGTPVIATKTEGAKEIIADGQTGLLVSIGSDVEIASKTKTLLMNPDERKRLGTSGAKHVRSRFSLAQMVNAIEEIYRESLK